MRILIIDKTAGLESSHERSQAIASMEGVELHVLGPRVWIENGRRVEWVPSESQSYQAYPAPVFGKGYYARVIYGSRMAEAMRKARPDIIQLLEEPWSLTALQAVFWAALFAPHAKLLFYTWENIDRGWNYPSRAGFMYALIDKTLHHRSAGAICATDGALNVLRNKGYDRPARVISYGVPDFFFQSSRRQPADKERFRVGYVGRMLRMKGVETLLDAAAKCRNIHLRLLGDGDDLSLFQQKAAELGIVDSTEWLDPVPEDELPGFLQTIDALVLPSITTPGWKEQLGRVMIEAMAAGVPVIGSDSGAIPYVIGDAGLIFSERDSVDLARSIQRYQHDPDLRARNAKRGTERAKQHFTWPAFARSAVSFYQSIIEGRAQ